MSSNTPDSNSATASTFADFTEAETAARAARSAATSAMLASAARAVVDLFAKAPDQSEVTPAGARAVKCK